LDLRCDSLLVTFLQPIVIDFLAEGTMRELRFKVVRERSQNLASQMAANESKFTI